MPTLKDRIHLPITFLLPVNSSIHLDTVAFVSFKFTMLQVREDDNRQLQNIANALAAAKKVVVITGAGISTNCGIPVRSSSPQGPCQD